jgi:arabinose-5-phosphate isomerase
MAMGDALAMALLDAKGFSSEDFARSHPGGNLGRRLLTHVSDIMHTGAGIPAVHHDALLADAVLEITRKRLGMTAIVDAAQHVLGIYTDGDLRRTLEKKLDFSTTPVSAVMSRNPRTITADALAAEVVKLMDQHNINQMLVVDTDNKLVGALNMHDLLRAKVI